MAEGSKKDGFFKKILGKVNKPLGYYEKAAAYSEGLSPRQTSQKIVRIVLSPFYIILKWTIFLLSIFLVILLSFLFLVFVYNLITGGGVSVFGTQFSILSSQLSGSIKAVTTPVYNFVTDPVGTIAQFGTFKAPETVEKRKPQGVEFKKFETKKPVHRSNIDPIEAIASVKIYALEDTPAQVKFSCEKTDPIQETATLGLTENIPANEVIISGELEGTNIVYLFEKQDQSKTIECKFDKVDLTALDLGGESTKTIQEKITLKANYEDFIVRSRLKVYTLEKDKLQSLESEGINPFSEFRISDPLISSDRSVRPEQLMSSPAILSLSLLDAQPLTDGVKYLLGMEISNDKLRWNGKISALKSLKLFFPDGFSPSEDNCKDFVLENNALVLKQDELRRLNEIEQERFYCDFTIDSSAVNDDLAFSLINAEAKFDYTFETYTTATISKNVLS